MSTAGCRLQELLRRPIFPSLSLLPPAATFATTSTETLNPHLSQILANSEHRLNLAQQRIQQLHTQQQNQHQQQHPQHPHQQPQSQPQQQQQQQQQSSNCQLQQPKRRYSCTQCPYSTDRRDLFRRHENIHRDEKPFRCYVCNKMFNRADHVKKHFLRIHKGLEYDVKLTKRIKGVDYDIKDSYERSLTIANSNGQLNNNGVTSNGDLNANVASLNHVTNCNGSGVYNRTVNVSVNINGNKSQHLNGNGNGNGNGNVNGNGNKSSSHCFTLFPAHPYLFSNGIHLPSMNQLKDETLASFNSDKESVSLFSNVQSSNGLCPPTAPLASPFANSANGHCGSGYSMINKCSDETDESEEENDETNTADYECEYCGCAFVNYPSLHTHRYLLHRYVNDKDVVSLYRCVICDHKSITQRAMMKHMLQHSKFGSASVSASASTSTSTKMLRTDDETKRVNSEMRSETTCGQSGTTANDAVQPSSRRKQLRPKKVIKTIDDQIEIEKCDKLSLINKFNCKICHKQFATYTQLIQHQMFFKHFH